MKNRSRTQSGKQRAPRQRSTRAQERAQANLSGIAPGWGKLREEQRLEWRRLAKGERIRLRNGRTRAMRGQELHNKLNLVQALLGRPAHESPLPRPRFGPNPVTGLEVANDGGGLALRLRVSSAPTQEIMVFGSAPRGAGQYSPGPFRFLGLLVAPKGGMCDITEAYIRAHGAPPVNTRVFIRVWPQANGWESRGQMLIFQGLVPAKGRRGGE